MSLCPRCQAVFSCGMADAPGADEACWCAGLPPLPRDAYPVNAGDRCLCPQCLLDAIAESAPRKAIPDR